MDSTPILVAAIGGFIVLIIVTAIFAAKAAEKRRQELLAFAQRHSFTAYIDQRSGCLAGGLFAGNSWPGQQLINMFQDFAPFGQGLRPRADNAIVGTIGERSFYFFDYQYETESTSTDSEGRTTTSRTTHRFGIAVVRVPLAMPPLHIGPEGFFNRIAGAIGFKDIQFESEEFNKRFNVRGPDQKFAFDLLHPQAMEYLLSLPKRDWQINGPYILCSTSGSFSVADYESILAEWIGFLDLIPDYLKQDIGFQPAWRSEMD